MSELPHNIGRYQILGLLGTGGMAEVLLARLRGPRGFERPVVIKRILPHLARQERFRDMFLDEARIVAGIRHQNVVQVQELGAEDQELFLVLEYLDGESASTLARRLSANRKLLSFGLSAHLMAEVAGGLHAAHELRSVDGKPQGLVHRDVSPANVFLTYSGEVKIIDFGIAHAADRVSRTDPGQVKGKYAYMSPEQCFGKALDRRSDVFSMGTCLYELSTCRRLFKRPSDMLTLQAVCHDEVVAPSNLVPDYPPELERIVLRALKKRPEDRYPSAMAMRRDLLAVAQNLNGTKVPEESLSRVMRKLFSSRIEEKQLMLRKLRGGARHVTIPDSDVDASIEIAVPDGLGPMSIFPTSTESPKRHDTATEVGPPGASAEMAWVSDGNATAGGSISMAGGLGFAESSRTRIRAGWAWVSLLLASGLGAGLWTWSEASSTAAAPPPEVSIRVVTRPPGALVEVDGERVGSSPVDFGLKVSSSPVDLEVSLDGHEGMVERVVPDRDQKLNIYLSPFTPGEQRPGSVEAEVEPTADDAPKRPAKKLRKRPGRSQGPEDGASPYDRFN